MNIYQDIGYRIRDVRRKAGMSQETLADRLRHAANTISRWETGTYRISIEDLYILAVELDVSPTVFLPKELIMESTELDTELSAWDALMKAHRHLTEMKSEQRTDRDRRIAVTMTELEKVMAYFNTYIMQPRTLAE